MTRGGCLGAIAVLIAVAVIGVVGVASVYTPFPSPTPLPRADARIVDDFVIAKGETIGVRRVVLEVPANALPPELDGPIPVHFEADIEVSADEGLRLEVVNGIGAEMVRQQRVEASIDVRWEVRCDLAAPCHDEFDLVFSRTAADEATNVRWRLKAQLRYPQGGLVPEDASLTLAVQDAAEPLPGDVLKGSGELEALDLSTDRPLVIRRVTVELTEADAHGAADLDGLHGFVRTELTAAPEPTPPPVDLPSRITPVHDPPPIEVLAWVGGRADPAMTRTLSAPGTEHVDQLELGSTCVAGRSTCTIEVALLFRLLSDRTDGIHRVTWRLDAELLAAADIIGSDAALVVTHGDPPKLEAVLQAEAEHEVVLTRESGFTATTSLSSLIDPPLLTPEMSFLPILSVGELTTNAVVSGSSRRPLLEVDVGLAGSSDSIRQFRPGEAASVRFVGFGTCLPDHSCGFHREIRFSVVDVAEYMSSDEVVTATITVQLTVLGFSSAETDGVQLTAEFR